MNTQASSRK